jgi:hypothetical protein
MPWWLDDYIVESYSHLCHLITTMTILVYAMMIVVYVIPYHFHDQNHGWMITILKDYVIMVVEFCNIKLNNNHGKFI